METVCEARGLTDSAITGERRAEVKQQATEIREARKSRPSSGISSRSISRSVRKTFPKYSEDDLYNMSLDQLREIAMREAFE
jgi:hypothetical protein